MMGGAAGWVMIVQDCSCKKFWGQDRPGDTPVPSGVQCLSAVDFCADLITNPANHADYRQEGVLQTP